MIHFHTHPIYFISALKSVVFFIIMMAGHQIAAQQIRLPSIFGDHMVLQRNKTISIWGWAKAGETIRVRIGKKTGKARVGRDGRWEVDLPAMAAGGPHQITITGQEIIILSDVLIGDVWICGGQSNMEWTFRQLQPAYQDMIAEANYPRIRLLTVEQAYSFSPQDDFLTDGWKVSTPASLKDFSAVGFFFGRAIYEHLDVPVGLISSNWGGTQAKPWISHRQLPKTNAPEEHEAVLQKGLSLIGNKVITRKEFNSGFQEKMSALDRQYRKNVPWSQGNINSGDWQLMPKAEKWENTLLPGYDGIVWMHKTIEIPSNWVGQPLWLNLGVVDDVDSTWFNGELVGSLGHRLFFRNYLVPGSLVKSGANEIVLKVLDQGGRGGLQNDGQYLFIAPQTGEGRISLSENWHIQPTISTKAISPWFGHHRPEGQSSLLFNAMIAPLTRFPAKGVIWYQGESNRGRPKSYRQTLTALINDWRLWWDQPRLPFFIVQLANYLQPQDKPSESNLALIREAQLQVSQTIPGTGLAVTIDIGDADDIHPKNKKDVGERLALAASRIAYQESLLHSGPVFKSMGIKGDTVSLSFDHVGSGLMIKGPAQNPEEFAIAGENRKFYRAKAEIHGDKIIVYSTKVDHPVAVRYAWADNPENANLYNKEGLPASPFRTDNWESEEEG